MYVLSIQQHFPQTPSTLEDFLHKYELEGGNLIIWLQHLHCRPFQAFYYRQQCLSQMRVMTVSSSATPVMLGNWWTRLHSHEVHVSVSWGCFFSYFATPFIVSCGVLGSTQWHNVKYYQIYPFSQVTLRNRRKKTHTGILFFWGNPL